LRKVMDEKDARGCLAAAARTGETLRSWANKNRVDGRSLRAWAVNLSRRSSTTAPASTARARLVELVPVTAPAVSRRYVLRAGNGSVEISDDFDPVSLARILEVLRAC
jgi:hypothetical protein